MRAPSHLNRGNVGFNMTPMIDVVFLLIIFFLVSSHLAKQETQLELDLPDAQSGQRNTEAEDVRRVVVNILHDEVLGGLLYISGKEIAPDAFTSLIQHELLRSQKDGVALEVRIRTDRRVRYRLVEPIMLACAHNGVWNVKFAVLEGG